MCNDLSEHLWKTVFAYNTFWVVQSSLVNGGVLFQSFYIMHCVNWGLHTVYFWCLSEIVCIFLSAVHLIENCEHLSKILLGPTFNSVVNLIVYFYYLQMTNLYLFSLMGISFHFLTELVSVLIWESYWEFHQQNKFLTSQVAVQFIYNLLFIEYSLMSLGLQKSNNFLSVLQNVMIRWRSLP